MALFDDAIFDAALFDTAAAATTGPVLPGWSHRKKYTFASSAELTNKHIILDVDRASIANETGTTIYVPLAESRWDFADIRFTLPDATVLVHGQETGSTVLETLDIIASPGATYADYGLGGYAVIGKLTADAGNQLLVAWRDPSGGTPPIKGTLRCYNQNGTELWSYTAATDAAFYSIAIVDPDVDSNNDVIVALVDPAGSGYPEIIVLDGATGVLKVSGGWSYTWPWESGYARGAAIGHFTTTNTSAKEWLGVAEDGSLVLLNALTGAQIYASATGFTTGVKAQMCIPFDCDGDGKHELFVARGDHIDEGYISCHDIAANGTPTLKWEYQIGNAAAVSRQLDVITINGVNCVVFQYLSWTPGLGGWGIIPMDANGMKVDAGIVLYPCSYYLDTVSPGAFAIRDFVGDGTKQIGIITGHGPSGGTTTAPAATPYGLGDVQVWDFGGNHLFTSPLPSLTQGISCVGSLDGTTEVWVLPLHNGTTQIIGDVVKTAGRFFVKIPTIAAADNDIYVHWGNANAVNTSDMSQIFDIFYEDFSNTSDWPIQGVTTPAYTTLPSIRSGYGTAKYAGSLDALGIVAPYTYTTAPTEGNMAVMRELAAQSAPYTVEWYQRNDPTQTGLSTGTVRHRVALRQTSSGTTLASPANDVSLETKIDSSSTNWVGIQTVAGTATTTVDANNVRNHDYRFMKITVGAGGAAARIDGDAAIANNANMTHASSYRLDLYGWRRKDGTTLQPILAGSVSQMRAYTTFTAPAAGTAGAAESYEAGDPQIITFGALSLSLQLTI